jgi:hypothetical protein
MLNILLPAESPASLLLPSTIRRTSTGVVHDRSALITCAFLLRCVRTLSSFRAHPATRPCARGRTSSTMPSTSRCAVSGSRPPRDRAAPATGAATGGFRTECETVLDCHARAHTHTHIHTHTTRQYHRPHLDRF